MPTDDDSTSNGVPNKEDRPIWENAIRKIGSTTSMVVVGTFFSALAYRRDAWMVSYCIGSVSNGVLSKVLKKVLRHERPPELSESDLDLPPSDKGMPSSHAMSCGFIFTFAAFQWPHATIPLMGYGTISLVYRIQTKLHTIPQILVGAVLGWANALLWRSLCEGTNPWGINILDIVSAYLLNEEGLLPWYALAVPGFVGLFGVRSIRVRIFRILGLATKKS